MATATGSKETGTTIKSKKLLDRVSEFNFQTYYVSESERKQQVDLDLNEQILK